MGQANRPSRPGFASTAEEVTQGIDLTGSHWLITGCSSGLGLETTRVLALRGAQVIGAARTESKAAAALSGRGGLPVACELSDPRSIRACVAQVRQGRNSPAFQLREIWGTELEPQRF